MKNFWDRYEIPTVFLGLALYASWLALTWWHDYVGVSSVYEFPTSDEESFGPD